MKGASFTASVVALARAIYTESPSGYPNANDPVATMLVPPGMQKLAKAAHRWGWRQPLFFHKAMNVATVGLFEHIALRTIAIDESILNSVDGGVRQLVILGAGLDSRGFRLKGAERLNVFEVDHPATQNYKRGRILGLSPKVGALNYVEVDFSKDDLGSGLLSSGFDPSLKTHWLMEGVSMYLSPPSLRSTLARIVELSSPGSVLSLTYKPPNPFGERAVATSIVESILRRLGEPLANAFAPSDMASLLCSLGMTVLSDEHTQLWRRQYTPNIGWGLGGIPEHMVNARIS